MLAFAVRIGMSSFIVYFLYLTNGLGGDNEKLIGLPGRYFKDE